MKSKLTGGATTYLFTTTVLGRHQVAYHRCKQTGFIQTDDPYWLDEAYSDAITQLDIGLLGRNLAKVQLTSEILPKISPDGKHFLDYGGGYGIFTRLMRDNGFPFVQYDPHCDCLFAKGFEIPNLDSAEQQQFDCTTAWEVFEHLTDPLEVFEQLTNHTRNLLFSTVLVPQPVPKSPSDWWYYTPETGQHIAFYTLESLEFVASKLGLNLYSDNEANHLLTRQPLVSNPFQQNRMKRRLQELCSRFRFRSPQTNSRTSLSSQDYQSVLSELQRHQSLSVESGDTATTDARAPSPPNGNQHE